MFVSQAINQDGSCQNVVDKLALNIEKDICISTSGYCKTRGRLVGIISLATGSIVDIRVLK
jgi:hypothetical protein